MTSHLASSLSRCIVASPWHTFRQSVLGRNHLRFSYPRRYPFYLFYLTDCCEGREKLPVLLAQSLIVKGPLVIALQQAQQVQRERKERATRPSTIERTESLALVTNLDLPF